MVSADSTQRSVIPFSFSASAVLQLLGAVAAFLASYVLPHSFPELGTFSSTILSVIGCIMLGVGVLNVFFGELFTRILQRVGMRSRVLLPREGLVYLAVMLILAVAALLGRSNMLLLLFGLMAGPFVLNGWVVVTMLHKVSVRRQIPSSATAGEFFSVELQVANSKPWFSSRLVEVRDVIEDSRHKLREESGVTFVRIPPQESRSGSYQVRMSNRGLYRFGPLRVSSRFPLGIGERGSQVSDRDEIIVHPAIGRLKSGWLRRERELSESMNRQHSRLGVFDDEFHRIREYRTGDNPRSIHWRSTARRGELMLQEFEQKREADLVVLLDLHEQSDFSAADVELAVSLAATICVEQTLRASSGTYRLIIAGKSIEDIHTTGAGRFREAALNALAVCEAAPGADLAGMMSLVRHSDVSSSERFVVITPRVSRAETLLNELSANGDARSMSLIPRTTIIPARTTELHRIFEPVSLVANVRRSESSAAATSAANQPAKDGQLDNQVAATASGGAAQLARGVRDGDYRLRAAFYRSVMLTAGLAGSILCAAEGRLFPCVLTPIVAVVAWVLVQKNQRLQLPLVATNILGLVALGAAIAEFVSGNIESKLLSGAHLIVYLTWIVLLMHKTNRQYWWIVALSLLQLAVASVLTSSGIFGASLFGMLLVMLWTMSVFSLYRVQERRRADVPKSPETTGVESAVRTSGPESAVEVPRMLTARSGVQRDATEPWISLRFRGVVVLLFGMSTVLSLIVFAAFPRIWVPGNPFSMAAHDDDRRSGIVHRTGFTDTVRLGEIGDVMQNDERVLQFSISEVATGARVSSDAFADAMGMDELRFRGNAMSMYADGQWTRGIIEKGFPDGEEESASFGEIFKVPSVYRVEISQDPPVSQFAFAVFPMVRARAMRGSGIITQRKVTNSLIWANTPESRISPMAQRSFVLECPRAVDHPDLTFEHWMIPPEVTAADRRETAEWRDRIARRLCMTEGLQRKLPRLYALSRQLCTDAAGELAAEQRIRRILGYLSAENGFRYSLKLTRSDANLDPVEDFLLNMKSGHCEYYASACTLMLQAAGLPARLINGFYGSEINTVTGKYEVKQRHAHSWVEVFVNGIWVTLDPTPGEERAVDVAAVKSSNVLSDLKTAFSDLWTGGIHNLTLEKQQAFFAPLMTLFNDIRNEIRNQGVGTTVMRLIREWVLSPEKWFSWQGGVVTFVLLLLVAGIARLHPVRRLIGAVLAVSQRFGGRNRTAKSVIRFYSRFCTLCENHGLVLPATATALENAGHAARHFASELQSDELRSLPHRIAAAFNEVRFGAADLNELQLTGIGNDVEAFAVALARPQPGTTTA